PARQGHLQEITRADHLRRLGRGPVDVHLPAIASARGERAALEETRGPQPLVDAHVRHQVFTLARPLRETLSRSMIRVLVPLSTAPALAVALLIVAPARAADTLVIEDWSKQPEGKTGIPEGWRGQSWGSPKYDFRIETVDGRKVIHLKSDGDSSAIVKEVKVDIAMWPILEGTWRGVKPPPGA